MTVQAEEWAMRDERSSVSAWVRRDLKERFGAVATEELPQEMLALLAFPGRQD